MGMAWVWYGGMGGYGMGMAWVWYGYGMGMVWVWYGLSYFLSKIEEQVFRLINLAH